MYSKRVTAKMGVPRRKATRVAEVAGFRLNGDYGVVCGERDDASGLLVNTEGDGVDERQDLRVSKGARHTATRREEE